MVKIRAEVCIISARGLGRSSSFWKPQWFAVGWIDPNNKYCSKIDASGSANPTWKTKFSALIDDSESNLKDVALRVQVYSREPIFLGEKLQGTAIILLKEFLAKYNSNNTTSAGGMGGGGVEEVGSFQLRKKKKKNSGKPKGFVDVSIRISEHRNGDNAYSYSGEDEGLFKLDDGSSSVPAPYPPPYAYPTTPHHPPSIDHHHQQHQPIPRAPTPPPPPPPSHVGYLPTFLPTPHHQFTPPPPPSSSSYVNLPPMSSSAPPRVAAPGGSGFGMGVGAGALAAGAVIFGDDFMSGFDLPSALQPQDATLTISTDPLF